MDYINTIHCSTKETPAQIFSGRSVKIRFDLLKPPLIKEQINKSQENKYNNFKGKRQVNFEVGQEVLIRDYKDPNKPKWSSAKIK